MATTVVNSRPVLFVVACALIDTRLRVLLSERPEGKNLAGLWEFPGGKVEPGETPEQALTRELWEEVGVNVQLHDLQPLSFISQTQADFHLFMPLYLCRSYEGEAHPREGQRLAWVEADHLADYATPPADKPLLDLLRQILVHPS